jgi:CelD/BcsL family acetyltransferase involved in cellulose biosynthesis
MSSVHVEAEASEDPAQPAPHRAAHAPPAKRHYSLKRKVIHLVHRVVRGAEAVAPLVLPILPNRDVAGEVRIGAHTVRWYKHWPRDAKLIADWDKLAIETPGATVYHSPYWLQPTARTPDAVGTLRLMTVHEGDRLVAAVPLERRWGGHWRTIGYLTNAYHDPLITADGRDQAIDALLRGLLEIEPHLKDLTFQMLAPGSPYLESLPHLARAAGFAGSHTSPTTTDTVVTLAATWEKYLESLPGHDRRELRRKIRKCEEKGGAKMVVHQTEDAVKKALDETFTLMEAEGGGKARKTRWLFRPLMKVAAGPLARTGRLVVYQLFIEGQLAAGNIALPQQNRQLMFNGAINAKVSHWSPGIVLWGMIIRRAIELGQPTLDLLRGLSTYKHELGAAEYPLTQLTLTR